jgi:hypothetical protein
MKKYNFFGECRGMVFGSKYLHTDFKAMHIRFAEDSPFFYFKKNPTVTDYIKPKKTKNF